MMKKTVKIKDAIVLDNGQKINQIALRKPLVSDLLEITREFKDAEDALVATAWIARLSGLGADEIGKMSLADFAKVNETLVEVLDYPHSDKGSTSTT